MKKKRENYFQGILKAKFSWNQNKIIAEQKNNAEPSYVII